MGDVRLFFGIKQKEEIATQASCPDYGNVHSLFSKLENVTLSSNMAQSQQTYSILTFCIFHLIHKKS